MLCYGEDRCFIKCVILVGGDFTGMSERVGNLVMEIKQSSKSFVSNDPLPE